MPDTIYGSRGTGNTLPERKIRDVAEQIALLEPSEAPYLSILPRLGKRQVFSPKFEWQEDQIVPRLDTINYGAGYNSSATSLVFDNAYFGVNDILLYPTSGEKLRVTDFDSSTKTATVTRGWASTSAASIPDAAELVNIGNAAEEGSTSQSAISTKSTLPYNYIQIFKTPVEITDVEEASKLYGGPDRAFQQRKAMIQHKIDMERAFLFGSRAETAGTSHYVRTTGGILSFISTNVQTGVGTFTESEMETFLADLFQYGSEERLALCSPLALSVISGWARDKICINDKVSTKYGLQVTDYISPHGSLKLIKHRLLTGSVYGGYIIFIDPANVGYCYMSGEKACDTKLFENLQANDATSMKDEVRTYAGLEVKLEKTHGYISGITG